MKKIYFLFFILLLFESCLDFSNRHFNGTIVFKSLDSANSIFGRIYIKNIYSSDTVKLETTNNTSKLYEIVNIGDTLIKKKGENPVELKSISHKNNGKYPYPFIGM